MNPEFQKELAQFKLLLFKLARWLCKGVKTIGARGYFYFNDKIILADMEANLDG